MTSMIVLLVASFNHFLKFYQASRAEKVTDLRFFPVWVFFHKHLRLTGQQGKG